MRPHRRYPDTLWKRRAPVWALLTMSNGKGSTVAARRASVSPTSLTRSRLLMSWGRIRRSPSRRPSPARLPSPWLGCVCQPVLGHQQHGDLPTDPQAIHSPRGPVALPYSSLTTYRGTQRSASGAHWPFRPQCDAQRADLHPGAWNTKRIGWRVWPGLRRQSQCIHLTYAYSPNEVGLIQPGGPTSTTAAPPDSAAQQHLHLGAGRPD